MQICNIYSFSFKRTKCSISFKKILESWAGILWVFFLHFNVQFTCLVTPVIIYAFLDKLTLIDLLAFIRDLCFEQRASPHIGDMILLVLVAWFLTDTEHQHLVIILKFFKVEYSHRIVPVWISIQFRFVYFFLLKLVFVLIHLLGNCHYMVFLSVNILQLYKYSLLE